MVTPNGERTLLHSSLASCCRLLLLLLLLLLCMQEFAPTSPPDGSDC